MKQLLFLLLFPCLALAQYQGNSNQKITLGEQTTADGLVWRGRLADTANLLTNKLDTSVYIVLDTGTRAMWYYRASTTPKWTRLVDSLNNLQGTLSVAKGGTGSATQNFVDLTTTQSIGGAKTFTSAVTATRFNPTANTATGTGMYLSAANTIGFSTNDSLRLEITSTGTVNFLNNISLNGTNSILTQTPSNSRSEDNAAAFYNTNANGYGLYIAGGGGAINGVYRHSLYVTDPERLYAFFKVGGDGNVGIGTYDPESKLNVMGTVRINSAAAPDANYYLQLNDDLTQKAKARAWDTYSDKRTKTDIQPIFNAIDKVNLLNPVYYQKHDSYVENDFLNIDYDSSVKSLGFIAQEVYNIIPEAVNTGTTNELWAMDYTKIIPILTKAIQEQQALIKALEQRIINLENK